MNHHAGDSATAALAQRTATVIGWVDDQPVARAELDERLALLRSGPRAVILPAPDHHEGRQLVRWTAHLLFTERLCGNEARRRGLRTDRFIDLDPLGAVQLGSITAAAWRFTPAVGAVFTAVVPRTDPVVVPRPTPVKRWRLSLATGPTPAAAAAATPVSIGWTTLADLPTALADAARLTRSGDRVGPLSTQDGWQVLVVDEVAEQPAFHPELPPISGADLRTFARWLDLRRTRSVRAAAGFEHPGDPAQPDNTHKH